jgi:hypothetical protein
VHVERPLPACRATAARVQCLLRRQGGTGLPHPQPGGGAGAGYPRQRRGARGDPVAGKGGCL